MLFNMAAVSLFWNTNMAAVTSSENALGSSLVTYREVLTDVFNPCLCAADVVLGRIEGIIKNSYASNGRFYKIGPGNDTKLFELKLFVMT